MSADVIGQWEQVFDLQNVAAHASLLPTGKVLYWGRRANPRNPDDNSLNEHSTKTYIWDPSDGTSKETESQPLGLDGKGVNLFCSGHTLQPDGTLLVGGGHLFDGKGVNQACVYDPEKKTWEAKPMMNNGRWYPSTLTLADGSVFCISGSYEEIKNNKVEVPTNVDPQIWRGNAWAKVSRPPNNVLLLYPRLHLDPKGRIFMAGPQAQSQFLDVNASPEGTWTTNGPVRSAGERQYAPSVMYNSGKIMYLGGGNDAGTQLPSKIVEFIDLNDAEPKWTTDKATDMNFQRRQHNATVLPDGTVLVNGGTMGGGPAPFDFNDLRPGAPVHKAELFDPSTKKWTVMAEEQEDRCYHSISLLLQDGRVLSAGGGEYSPNNDGHQNPPKDTLTNAQLYKPPYFFKGARPSISNAPRQITYGQNFDVTVNAGQSIAKASWVRLGSATHASNMNQSLIFLEAKQEGTKVTITGPTNPNIAPPGDYMLFALNQQGLPSEAPIIRLKAASTPAKSKPTGQFFLKSAAETFEPSLPELSEQIKNDQDRPAVVVGLTPVCPYGLGPCWGGAFDALQQISDVDVVRPVPDQDTYVAYVYLKHDVIPDIDVWRAEFEARAGGSYDMRGLELTINGVMTKKKVGADEQLSLAGTSTRSEVVLAPFKDDSNVEYNNSIKAPRAPTEAELGAYAGLAEALAKHPEAEVQVTGSLRKHGSDKFSLEVKSFEVAGAAVPDAS